MKDNNNSIKGKNTTVTTLILFLVILIALFLAFITGAKLAESKAPAPASKAPTSSSTIQSSESSSSSSSGSTESSSAASTSTTESTPAETVEQGSYCVTFPKGAILMGETTIFGFSVTTYPQSDKLAVSYSPKGNYTPGAHMSSVAGFYPTDIPMTTIPVNENGVTKNVTVSTELKLSESDSSKPDLAFFLNFNNNDTKVFAYLNNNKNVVLAFTPPNNNGPYIAVVLYETQM
jgi:cytoskeletal protein RodZ